MCMVNNLNFVDNGVFIPRDFISNRDGAPFFENEYLVN